MQLMILEDNDGEYQFATREVTPPQLTSIAECIRTLLEGLVWNGRGPDRTDTTDMTRHGGTDAPQSTA